MADNKDTAGAKASVKAGDAIQEATAGVNVFERRLSSPLVITRDESKFVKAKVLHRGCFVPSDPLKPQILTELEVGKIYEFSVGRADGMTGKIEIVEGPYSK